MKSPNPTIGIDSLTKRDSHWFKPKSIALTIDHTKWTPVDLSHSIKIVNTLQYYIK